MKLAINYSPQAAELLSQQRIQLDFFKCPDWPWMIDEACRLHPVAVHFPLDVGAGKLAQTNWQQVENLRAATGTPYVNVHIAAYHKDYPEVTVHDPTPAQARQLRDTIFQELELIVQRFGPENVIAENCPYHAQAGDLLRTCVEPEVIRQAIETTGCGLLFDLSHARISAHHLGLSEEEYFANLPMQQLREMHFTGLHTLDGRLVDHLSALPQDWVKLAEALKRIRSGEWGRPWMLAFEYGGVGGPFSWRSESSVIAEQMPILYEMVQAA